MNLRSEPNITLSLKHHFILSPKEQPGQHGAHMSDLQSSPPPPSNNNNESSVTSPGFDETDAHDVTVEQMTQELQLNDQHNQPNVRGTATGSHSRRGSVLAGGGSSADVSGSGQHFPTDHHNNQSAAPTPSNADKASFLTRIKDSLRGQDGSGGGINTDNNNTSDFVEGADSPGPATEGRRRFLSYIPHFPEPKTTAPSEGNYRPIEEHGLVGNMKTVALIGTDAEVTYFSYPYFDSPSIFASILDSEKGGYWAIRSAVESHAELYGKLCQCCVSR